MTLLFALLLAASSTPSAAVASYTATSANVSGAPDNIRIEILRWSTDAERDKLMDAWMLKTVGTPGRAGRGGRGAGRAGRGGGETPAPAKASPEATLATALQAAPTLGYLWSREVAGYAIRYAGKIANPDGSERVVLITNRRLGAVNDLWKPANGDPLPYDFSVIELHLNAHGSGEGKASLTGKVAPIGLENYEALPVVLSKVERKSE